MQIYSLFKEEKYNMSLLGIMFEHAGYSMNNVSDIMPHYELSEASSYASLALQEIHNDAINQSRKMDEELMKSALSESASVDTILEATGDALSEKIRKMFEKIKQFFVSVYKKIRMFFDKIFMSSKNLVSKYKNHKNLSQSFDNLSYSGYEYVDGIADKWANVDKVSSVDDIHKHIVTMCGNSVKKPSEFRNSYESGQNIEAGKKELEALKDVSESERKERLIKSVTGVDVTSDTAKSDLLEALQGSKERVTITGVDKFQIMDYLSNPEKESNITKFYENIIRSVDTVSNNIRNEANAIKRDNANGTDEQRRGADLCYSYFDAYANIASSTFKCLSVVGDAKTSAIRSKVKQYRKVFGKMLTYKSKNASEAASFIDAADDFDFSVIEAMI